MQADVGQQGCPVLCGSVCSPAASLCVWCCVLLSLVRITNVDINSKDSAHIVQHVRAGGGNGMETTCKQMCWLHQSAARDVNKSDDLSVMHEKSMQTIVSGSILPRKSSVHVNMDATHCSYIKPR